MGVHWLALSSASRHAVSASFDRSLRLWDLQTGREVRRFHDNPGFDTGFVTTVASHRRLHGLAGAVEKLPAFLPGATPQHEKQTLQATGTDNASGGWP